ncbi:MAG: PEP-CTERM sorting domain-containing protein [Phycisphaerales bacterium]|nr:MAG: PEP-CTERM sorting domain-containing protein [Phycisphaerales bacterium]
MTKNTNGVGVRAAMAVAALVLTAGAANAAIVYSTDFNAPTYGDAALVGQDGWLQTGTVATNPLMVANTGTNGNVFMTTGQDANHPFAAITTDSVLLSADIVVSTASTAGDYFLHLSDGGTSAFNARIYVKSDGAGGFVMAMGTAAGAVVYGTTPLTFGTPYRITARYDFVSGLANDTGELFVDPAGGFPLPATTSYALATTVGTDATTIAAVNLRQGSATNAPGVTVDNIVVEAVPAPGAIALLGLGGLVASRRRRA